MICFDFETTTQNGKISGLTDEPIQLTAQIIHPRRLEVVKDSLFSTFIKPPDGFKPTEDSLQWHAKVRGVSVDQILEWWNSAPSQQSVWDSFAKYLDRYHSSEKRKSIWTAPIRAGYNIIAYDNLIWQRMCERYGYTDKEGGQNLTRENYNIDIMHNFWMWTENNPDIDKLGFDNVRKYLGMKTEGGHNSDVDVDQCSQFLIKLIKLHRYVADRTKFKDSFAKEEEVE